MSAERLRQAAKVLRQRADGAQFVSHTEWGTDGHQVVSGSGGWCLVATTSDIPVDDRLSSYIATMHPGVGLALADWLGKAADELSRHLPVWEQGIKRYPESWVGRTVEDNVQHHYGHALAIADLILGGAS